MDEVPLSRTNHSLGTTSKKLSVYAGSIPPPRHELAIVQSIPSRSADTCTVRGRLLVNPFGFRIDPRSQIDPAVNVDDFAGNVAGLLAGEVAHEAGDLGHVGEALERDLLAEVVLNVVRK